MLGCLATNRNTWKTSAVWLRPIIQLTNLTIRLGTAVGPQITRPFLNQYDIASNNDTINVTVYEGLQPVQSALFVVAALDIAIAIVCMIVGVWSVVYIGQCNTVLDLVSRDVEDDDDIQLIPGSSDASAHDDGQQLSETETPKTETPKADVRPQPVKAGSVLGCVLLTVAFLFFFMNAGRDVLLTALLYTYLNEFLNWSVNESTFLVSIASLVRFVSGALVIPITPWVAPSWLITVDLVIMLISAVLMVVALIVVADCFTLTTIGVIGSALGDANIHPTLITLVEVTIPVTSPVMALFISAYGLSLMIIGPIAGALLEVSIISFPLMILALTLAGVLLFIIYSIIVPFAKYCGYYPQQYSLTALTTDSKEN